MLLLLSYQVIGSFKPPLREILKKECSRAEPTAVALWSVHHMTKPERRAGISSYTSSTTWLGLVWPGRKDLKAKNTNLIGIWCTALCIRIYHMSLNFPKELGLMIQQHQIKIQYCSWLGFYVNRRCTNQMLLYYHNGDNMSVVWTKILMHPCKTILPYLVDKLKQSQIYSRIHLQNRSK